MSAPIILTLRPMTTGDMIPGHSYEPDMSILTVASVPGIVNGRDPGYAIDVPMLLPEKYRSQTPENMLLALHYLRALEPEVYEDVVRHARAARTMAAAKHSSAGQHVH
jgi:hypothetical protein